MPSSLPEIERIYRERYPQLLRVAVGLTGDRERARDVVHEAFVHAIRSRAELRREASIDAWIWRILVNTANAERRRALRRDRIQPEEAPRRDEPELGAVRAAVAALPERQRAVLFLRYYADLDYEAIGDALGMARGTVAATLHAARAVLRAQFTEAPL